MGQTSVQEGTVGFITRAIMIERPGVQIQAVLGGNIKLVISGSAPISAEVLDFLKIALSCDIVEGEYFVTSSTCI
jgi:long-chain acyl-CoA synthetase